MTHNRSRHSSCLRCIIKYFGVSQGQRNSIAISCISCVIKVNPQIILQKSIPDSSPVIFLRMQDRNCPKNTPKDICNATNPPSMPESSRGASQFMMSGVMVLNAPIIIPCKNRQQKNNQKLGIKINKPRIIELMSKSKMLFLKSELNTSERAV